MDVPRTRAELLAEVVEAEIAERGLRRAARAVSAHNGGRAVDYL